MQTAEAHTTSKYQMLGIKSREIEREQTFSPDASTHQLSDSHTFAAQNDLAHAKMTSGPNFLQIDWNSKII